MSFTDNGKPVERRGHPIIAVEICARDSGHWSVRSKATGLKVIPFQTAGLPKKKEKPMIAELPKEKDGRSDFIF